MKQSVNLVLTVAGGFAAVIAAAVAIAASADISTSNAPASSGDAVFAAETLPMPMPTTRASTAYFDGINEGVISIGAYE